MPSPEVSWLKTFDARKNFEKILSTSEAGTPTPWSLMDQRTCAPKSSREIEISPGEEEYRIALSIRREITDFILVSSARTENSPLGEKIFKARVEDRKSVA